MQKGIEVQLNVKPVFFTFYHDVVFEGPCRQGSGHMLEKDFDLASGAEKRKKAADGIARHLSDIANIMPAVEWSRNEEFILRPEFIDKISEDMAQVDAYLIPPLSRMADVCLAIAETTGKPIVLIPPSYTPLHSDCAANLNARDKEVYCPRTWEKCRELIKVLRAKKALKNTTVLCAARFGTTDTPGDGDNFINYDCATKRFGVHFKFINIHELLDYTHVDGAYSNFTTPIRAGHNITLDEYKEVEKLADELIANADECVMTREEVINSFRAHYTIKKMLDHYGCNAFCAPCPDACATTRLNQEHFTFCMNHSLLNEVGVPSACEYDLSATLSMQILMTLNRTGAYMGNTTHWVNSYVETGALNDTYFWNLYGCTEQAYKEKLKANAKDIIFTWHSVPNRSIHGFDKKEHYSLRPFTGSGWGVTLRYDFNQDEGQTVTMCRIDPSCRRLFVAKGTVVAGRGQTDNGCTLGVFIRVKDGEDFFNKQMLVGNHIPLVYGDCFENVCELGRQLGMEVITA